MRAALGIVGLLVSFQAAVIGIVVLLIGLQRHNLRLLRIGRRLVFVVLAGALAAVIAMEWALLTNDFSLEYVARHHARATPTLFTISSLWAALEGSILLWCVILAGYLCFMVRRFRDRADDRLVAWATITGLVVAAFFFGLVLGPANPFDRISPVPLDGDGPNALLQNHPLMAFHPPTLYLGYVGFTIPFAFSIAALITGRVGEGWLIATRRATLVAWGFLTAGIVLGSWWSYEVLSWGGFWAWDPVENASLLPWLTATAYLHSVMIQERRGMLRVWNLSLIIATFCLTILGTFLTRSGVIGSVHAFTQSSIGPALLVFLAVVGAAGIGLIGWRGDRLRAPGRIDSAISREGAFLANNLLFAGFCFVVLLGTVFPLLAEAFDGTRLTVGEPYFDRMTLPIGLALLFLMAVAPALPWRAASREVLRSRLIIPAWGGGLTMLIAAVVGARSLTELVAFGLGAFALVAIGRQIIIGVRSRRRATGERTLTALVRTATGNPRLYGGLVVHVGVVIIAMSMTAQAAYSTHREVRLQPGQTATVAGYRLTYLERRDDETAQKRTRSARIRIERGGHSLGVYAPSISIYPNAREAIGSPSVRTGLIDDVYLTVVSQLSDDASEAVTFGVFVNRLMLWLWLGGLVMVLGTLLAIGPSIKRGRRRPAGPAGPREDEVIDLRDDVVIDVPVLEGAPR